MGTFPRTRTAAEYIAGQRPGDLARAVVLLTRLRACEDALASADGEIPAPVQGLLRALVIAARNLAGPAWLAANDDTPDIAAFTALDSTPAPPAPAVLDQVISQMLRARSAPHHIPRPARAPAGPRLLTRPAAGRQAAMHAEPAAGRNMSSPAGPGRRHRQPLSGQAR